MTGSFRVTVHGKDFEECQLRAWAALKAFVQPDDEWKDGAWRDAWMHDITAIQVETDGGEVLLYEAEATFWLRQ